jgi:ABC-type nickel/cobalt efflux system permease component RcnA
VLATLVELQGWIKGSLTGYLNGFAATRDWVALASVLPLGIVFGAVHALTPGHGKSILASYLIGSRLAALRGVLVSSVLSVTHVGLAVVIAVAALPPITRTLGGAGQAPALEAVSRGLLVLIGAWMIVRAIRGRPHQHDEGEGVMVGVVAGLVPCPITLFAMFMSMSRGVPEAGLTFAASMMIGVAMTLAAVALVTIVVRDRLVAVTARWGTSIQRFGRVLDGTAGLLMVAVALWSFDLKFLRF